MFIVVILMGSYYYVVVVIVSILSGLKELKFSIKIKLLLLLNMVLNGEMSNYNYILI